MRRIFLVFLFFIINLSLYSQSIEFDRITTRHGLSQNTINCLYQGSKGFIWVGTEEGLNKFDGNTFRKYKPDPSDSNSISGNSVHEIYEDSDGLFWIGTWGFGLNSFDPRVNQFKSFNVENSLLPNNIVMAIIENKFNSNKILIGTSGGIVEYNKELKIINPHESLSKLNIDVRDFYYDSTNRLWISTFGQGLYIYNEQNSEIKNIIHKPNDIASLSDNRINVVHEDNEGNFWIGTLGSGLNKINLNTYSVKRIEYKKNNNGYTEENYIRDIHEDDEGKLWLATRNGIDIYDPVSEDVLEIIHSPEDNKSISTNYTMGFLYDRSGVLWIGTYGGGLNKYDPYNKKFNLIKNNPYNENSISNNYICAIFEDNDENLWFGAWEGGLNKYNTVNGKIKRYLPNSDNKNSLSSETVYQIFQRKNKQLLIGTRNGIDIYNPKADGFENIQFSNSPQNVIRSIYEDRNEKLWIGTDDGLIKYFEDNQKIFHPLNKDSSISAKRFFSIVEFENNLWIGSENGLHKFDLETEKFVKSFTYQKENGLSYNWIWIIHKSNGDFWIGTRGGGLNKFNPISEKFEVFTEDDGLANNVVVGIMEDDSGSLWLSTNNGISKFDPMKKQFLNFNESDNLQGPEFNGCSFYKTKNGTMYFGGTNGINYFHPIQLQFNKSVPNIELLNLKQYNKSIPITESGILTKSLPYTNEIELSYEDNFINIEYTALDFSSWNKHQFAYKLDGLDNQYHFVGNNRIATYTNLPSGEFVFHVIGANGDGIWNNIGRRLIIKVLPAPWATWYAYLGYLILVLFLIIFLSNIRNKRQKLELTIKGQELEHEIELNEQLKKVDKLKSEFLAQMSHEIRTPINTILSFTSLVEDEFKETATKDTKTSFEIISNAGERIIRTIDLILNMSEIQTGTYDYTPANFNLYHDVLEKLGMEYKFLAEQKNLLLNFEISNKHSEIYSDRYLVIQIFDNLINNAIKYTNQGSVTIKQINQENGKPIVEIIDTGIGIAKEQLENIFNPFTQEEQGYTRKFEGNGLGLSLVNEYCELINAEIQVESIKGTGSTFKVIFR